MSTPFNTIIRETIKHVNGILGASASSQASAYLTSPITTTQADDPVFNLNWVQDRIIDVHGRIALEIASVADPNTGIGCHPWRSFFRDSTSNVAHGGDLPTTGSSGKTIIGALGRPHDSSDVD